MRHQYSQTVRPFRAPQRQPLDISLKRAMARVDVRFLCEHVCKLPKRDGYYFSPVRDDGQNPAFAVHDNGQVAIDHGTGEGFNALTLVARVEGIGAGVPQSY